MRTQPTLRAISCALTVLFGSSPAFANFDTMQIEQVIGGVQGDTSAQAIQLRMRADGAYLFFSFARLVVWDAAGLNPIVVKDFTSDVLDASTGDRLLIVSSNFANYTSPAVSPDFVMTQPIPASYLAAGRLTYESDAGTIYWSLSWGGAGYTGPQTGDTVNDPNGNFGPAYGSALPSSGTSALKFNGVATAPSTSNLADYSPSVAPAGFENYAGYVFTVVGAVKPSITAPPSSQAVNAGSNATFCATAGGPPPLSFQWQFNGANISGETGACYTRPNAQFTEAGDYAVVVTNAFGSVTSSVATLTVIDPTRAIRWSTLDGGGGTSTGGVFQVTGTIGQPDAGRMSGGNFSVDGGFWSIITAVQTLGAPMLTIALTTTNTALVSWPSPSTGFILQENTNSVASANWSNVSTIPVDTGPTRFIIVNPTPGNRFYRLFKP